MPQRDNRRPTMTQREIDRLKELHAKATGGEWRVEDCNVVAGHRAKDIICSSGRNGTNEAWVREGRDNIAFIAAAHNALPRLIAEVEEARRHLCIMVSNCECPIREPGMHRQYCEEARRFLGETDGGDAQNEARHE